jgi:hypothetical protein
MYAIYDFSLEQTLDKNQIKLNGMLKFPKW